MPFYRGDEYTRKVQWNYPGNDAWLLSNVPLHVVPHTYSRENDNDGTSASHAS